MSIEIGLNKVKKNKRTIGLNMPRILQKLECKCLHLPGYIGKKIVKCIYLFLIKKIYRKEVLSG